MSDNKPVIYMSWKPSFSNPKEWDLHFTEDRCKMFLNFISNIDDKENPEFCSSTCNLWNGATSQQGAGHQHGMFYVQEKTSVNVNRLMFMLTYGIPVDHDISRHDYCPCDSKQKKTYQRCCRPEIRHRCIEMTGEDHKGLCLNPLHLVLGDHSSNMHDIRVDGTGKGHIHKGDEHPRSSISEEKAREIWKDKGILTMKQIAEKHGVKHGFVKDMACGRTWNDVTGISNAKRVEHVKQQRDKKYYAECIRRKEMLESKGYDYWGDFPPVQKETKEEKTTNICSGLLCAAKKKPKRRTKQRIVLILFFEYFEFPIKNIIFLKTLCLHHNKYQMKIVSRWHGTNLNVIRSMNKNF